MVLIGTSSSRLAKGLKGQKRRYQKAFEKGRIDSIINLCEACQLSSMSCVPPSAFSAGRIRETQRDMKVSQVRTSDSARPTKYLSDTFMELSPLKYNSKLMNSIWGFYNRYSPHNVKKVSEPLPFAGELQQSTVNSSSKGEPVLALPSKKLDNVWAAINVSQSH